MKIKISFLISKLILPGLFFVAAIMLSPGSLAAAGPTLIQSLFSIRIEFILFAIMLAGVAIFHKHTMYIALTGLVIILIFKMLSDPHFAVVLHFIGSDSIEGEWKTLLNLCGLLFGFAILARQFEDSKVPEALPDFLPSHWTGGFLLLFFIFIMSTFLDNIAAAMIGGTIAMVVYNKKVHIGYLAAIVAASNAGGAGSVIGDTTTTLMWIDGVHALTVSHAFIASIIAFLVFGTFGSLQQHRYCPLQKLITKSISIDWMRIGIVIFILASTIAANILFDFPALGVWFGIVLGSFFRKTPWHEIKNAWQGTVFLLSLITAASLMPVNELPTASLKTTFVIGFISSVFDNIPLTKLCLEQGGYDWGFLAYAVGFGGSMIWFGSSAGVALSNKFPELKSVVKYALKGWHVILSYILGFLVMVLVDPWHIN